MEGIGNRLSGLADWLRNSRFGSRDKTSSNKEATQTTQAAPTELEVEEQTQVTNAQSSVNSENSTNRDGDLGKLRDVASKLVKSMGKERGESPRGTRRIGRGFFGRRLGGFNWGGRGNSSSTQSTQSNGSTPAPAAPKAAPAAPKAAPAAPKAAPAAPKAAPADIKEEKGISIQAKTPSSGQVLKRKQLLNSMNILNADKASVKGNEQQDLDKKFINHSISARNATQIYTKHKQEQSFVNNLTELPKGVKIISQTDRDDNVERVKVLVNSEQLLDFGIFEQSTPLTERNVNKYSEKEDETSLSKKINTLANMLKPNTEVKVSQTITSDSKEG